MGSDRKMDSKTDSKPSTETGAAKPSLGPTFGLSLPLHDNLKISQQRATEHLACF